MFDALKRFGGGSRSRSDETEAALAELRKERESVTALLGRLKRDSVQIKDAATTLSGLEATMMSAGLRLEEVTTRVAAVETSAAAALKLDVDVSSLVLAVRDAQQSADRLLSPDGELQRQRQVVQQLAAQSMQARATLDTLTEERATLDRLRGDLQTAQAEVQAARDRAAGVAGEAEAMRAAVAASTREQERISDLVRQSRDDASAAVATVREVDARLQSFAKLQDLALVLDQKLSLLNATAEHVTQKAKILDNQKHTTEQAIVQSHRLNEMIAAMDLQIGRLNDGGQRAARVEETVERVERLFRESEQHLDQMQRMRDSLSTELGRLDRVGAGLVAFVQTAQDRLAAERHELDASQVRVNDLQEAIARAERAQESLATREKDVTALSERTTALGDQLVAFETQSAEVGRKMESLLGLKDELASVDETSRRVSWQMESLKSARVDLEELRAAIQGFYAQYAEASQLRDRLSADRASLEEFLARMGAFSVQLPELDARMSAIKSKLSSVDKGTEKAANLVAIADDLDRHMTRITGYQQFVERVESRVNALNGLSAEVDHKVGEQLKRRGEIDALSSTCESVLLQVTDVRQRLEGVAQTQGRLLPMATHVAALQVDVDRAQAGLAAALRDQAEITNQERRIAEMLEKLQSLSGETAAGVEHVETLTSALSRSETIKDLLLKELSVVQGRQREVAGQLQATDAQAQHLDGAIHQLEQRRDQLAFAEKRIAGLEARIEGLTALADTLDRREEGLAGREEALHAVRREVEGVREISARSKADLQALEAHRDDIVALRARVDDLLVVQSQTERQAFEIEARRRLVDEVHMKVNLTAAMLDDVRVNLETVGEQKVVLDHTLTSLAKLSDMMTSAQATLRALQAERELAERIEHSITALRSKTTPAEKRA